MRAADFIRPVEYYAFPSYGTQDVEEAMVINASLARAGVHPFLPPPASPLEGAQYSRTRERTWLFLEHWRR
jgi:hypothetical protein